MDPSGLTLRQLDWMAEERLRSQWNQTSTVLAAVLNVNRDPRKSRPVRPEQLNPYARREPPPVLSPEDARAVFSAIASAAR